MLLSCMNLCLWISLVSLSSIRLTDAAQILGIFPVPSKSHHCFFQPVVEGLANRGHNVTVISPFQSISPVSNYTAITLEDKVTFIDSFPIEELYWLSYMKFLIPLTIESNEEICEKIMQLDYIKRLLRFQEKPVDLLIAETYYTHCFSMLAEKLDIPLIIISTVTTGLGPDLMIGNPNNPAYVPYLVTPFSSKMKFIERLMNTCVYVFMYVGYYWYFNPYAERLAREHLHMELPPIEVLHKRVSLILGNNHFSVLNRPAVPNVIDIGGIHMKQPKALPPDLQQFIDDAEHGVIYFSFGSYVKASTLPPEKRNIINRVLSKIPQRVLWRVDNLSAMDVPKNVKLSQWFPQRDILEHKNVRLFITHTGISSTFETIYTGKPVVAIPLTFDQFQNAASLVDKGIGVYLKYDTLTVNEFLSAINEVINNTKYKENAQKLSTIFKDRPMTPLETAMYWCEYVLRHEGAPHLRSPAAEMPLYQYLLLDVIAFLLSIFILVVLFCTLVIRSILSYCRRTGEVTKLKVN